MALLLTMLLLSGILVVTLTAADLVMAGIKMNRLTGYSSLAFFASEAGLERALWEARKSGNPLSTDNNSDFLKCSNNLQSCSLVNNSSYAVKYTVSAPNVTFKSIGKFEGAKRSVESAYSVDFFCGTNSVVYDGVTYPTVLIGDQCWFAKNLNIGEKIDYPAKQTNNGVIEKYCYDNNEENCNTYGGLYQWDEAMGYSLDEGAQGICPFGWHIPSDAEWHKLEMVYAIPADDDNCDGKRPDYSACTPAGKELRSGGSSGFNALLAGFVFWDNFYSMKNETVLLSSSIDKLFSTTFWGRRLYSGFGEVGRHHFFLDLFPGLSVRCIMD